MGATVATSTSACTLLVFVLSFVTDARADSAHIRRLPAARSSI
jgi:hypothetical protein